MKLEITIPTKLSEIKLSQYQAFLKIAKDNEDTEFLHQKMVQHIYHMYTKQSMLGVIHSELKSFTQQDNNQS